MFQRMNKLINSVTVELGLASGDSVQTYSNVQIKQNLINSFDHFFGKRFWDHLTYGSIHDLDEEDGVVTTDIVAVNSLDDVEFVKHSVDGIAGFEESARPLPYRPKEVDENPYSEYYKALPPYHSLANTRLFQVFPRSTVGKILVRARRYPELETENPIVPFDALCLVHFTTANILANDGMNPNAQVRHDALLAQRYEDLIANESKETLFYGRARSRAFSVAEDE
jgi:hypothetical protein